METRANRPRLFLPPPLMTHVQYILAHVVARGLVGVRTTYADDPVLLAGAEMGFRIAGSLADASAFAVMLDERAHATTHFDLTEHDAYRVYRTATAQIQFVYDCLLVLDSPEGTLVSARAARAVSEAIQEQISQRITAGDVVPGVVDPPAPPLEEDDHVGWLVYHQRTKLLQDWVPTRDVDLLAKRVRIMNALEPAHRDATEGASEALMKLLRRELALSLKWDGITTATMPSAVLNLVSADGSANVDHPLFKQWELFHNQLPAAMHRYGVTMTAEDAQRN